MNWHRYLNASLVRRHKIRTIPHMLSTTYDSSVHATQSSPFRSTSVSSFNEAPRGFFFPRSHCDIKLVDSPRCLANTA
jgi:hypothetical protein